VRDRANLIDDLVADDTPVDRYRSPDSLTLIWVLCTWSFVLTATLLIGPNRSGFIKHHHSSPHFAFETLVGLMAGIAAGRTGLLLGYPYPRVGRRQLGAALGLLACWIGLHVYGLWSPALEPSMLGKRATCVLEVLVYGTPPMLAGLMILRRRACFRRFSTGAWVGAAAGAVPGLLMQLACMYDPQHILAFHLGPVAVLAVIGAALGPLVLRRI
jgi:hypothetical protein